MQEWWTSPDIYTKVLWMITLTASLIFVVQTVLTFIGMDSDTSMDASTDTDASAGVFPFELFTFRNFINFFLGFGWTAIALQGKVNGTIAIILACLAGVLLVAAVMYIFYLMSKMEQSGNINMANAVGCKGSVYLKIPAARNGEGKIQITIQGAIREYDAVTNGEELPTGTPIAVTQVLSENILVVAKA